LLAIISILLMLCGSVRSQDTEESCEQLIGHGEYQKAFEKAQSLYSEDSTEAVYALMYTRFIRQGSTARAQYRALGEDTAADIHIRAEALYRLGCMAYAAGNCADAENYAKNACRLVRSEEYLLLYVRSALLCGHEVIATRMLASGSKKNVTVESARLYTGLAYYKLNDYSRALESYSVLAAHPGTPQWLTSCLAIQALCNAKLKHVREASQIVNVLESGANGYLEQANIDSIRPAFTMHTDTAKASVDAKKTNAAVAAEKRAFRVQAGLFRDIANAKSFKAELDGYFSDVRIVPLVKNSDTFFRVVIGAFPSRDAAAVFAHKEFTVRKLNYCIIEE